MSFTSKIGSLASRAYGWSAAVARAVDQYFEYVTLLLPGNGTNGAQNNTFLDGSTNNFTITRNGNTTQGTFSPFSQTGWGNYFNGSSQYLSTADNAAFTMGSGDFTIEYWTYFLGGSDLRVYGQFASSLVLSTISFFGGNSSGNKVLNGVYSGTTGYTCTSTADMPTNQWVHIAFVRDGNTLRQYINGVQDGTSNVTGVSINDSSTQLSIGRVGEYAAQYWNGHISNFRIVKGRCVYPSGTTFNPPTAPLTRTTGGTNPPQGTECSLLTCQSNRFLDSNGVNTPASSPLTITPNGSPTVVAFSPFNPTASWSAATYGGSGYFDGSGDYLTAPASNITDFSSGQAYTFECWFYTTSTATQCLLKGDTNGFFCDFSSSFIGFGKAGVAYSVNASTTITTNQWYHVAVSRNTSNQSRIWLNGNSVGSNSSDTYAFNNVISYIGREPTAINHMFGYISNVRVVKGTAVYDPTQTSITVPTAPLTAITNTSLLLNFTNAGIYDATSKNDLETVGNAQISTAQSKWGGSSMSFDGTGDYLLLPDNVNLQIGSGDYTIEFWLNASSLAGSFSGIVDTRTSGGVDTNGFTIYFSTSQLRFRTNGSDILTYSSFPTGTWTYVAITRSGSSANNTKLFINGTQQAQATNTTSFTQTSRFVIGTTYPLTGDYYNGYMQDLRITRYARTITASPTAAFPTL